jgi:hypothetical protein
MLSKHAADADPINDRSVPLFVNNNHHESARGSV